jgi:hypothetical protein
MMKKIITSAAVVAALTTAAFAGATLSGDFPKDSEGKSTFNKNYMTNAALTVETNTTSGVAYTGFGVKKDEWLVFTLEGADFNTTMDYVLLKDGIAVTDPVNNDIKEKVAEFKLTGDINVTDTLVLGYHDSADVNKTVLILPKSADKDVTITATAQDATGTALKNSDTTVKTLIEMRDYTSKLDLKDCQTRLINSDDKSKFVEVSSDTTTATCVLDITMQDQATYDYNVSDANITINVSDVDFDEGNITSSVGADSEELNAAGTGIDIIGEDDTVTDRTITFTIDSGFTGDLTADTMSIAAELVVGSDTAGTTFSEPKTLATLAKEEAMKYLLSTYSATILNMKYDAASATETKLFVYNNSTTKTTATVKAVTASGEDLGTVHTFEIDANSVGRVFASALYGINPKMALGYKVTVDLDVDAKKGDILAQQVTPGGMIRLKETDNNTDNSGN